VRRISTALLSVALTGLMFVASARACSCAPLAPGESLRQADAAIVARLVKVVPRGRLHADYRYEVQRVYRGRSEIRQGQMLSVQSARRAAACALPRRLDRSYGLFLALANGRWFSGICGVVEPRRLRHAAEGQSRIGRRVRAGAGPDPCGSV
jgi:hypothetical protein